MPHKDVRAEKTAEEAGDRTENMGSCGAARRPVSAIEQSDGSSKRARPILTLAFTALGRA